MIEVEVLSIHLAKTEIGMVHDINVAQAAGLSVENNNRVHKLLFFFLDEFLNL